MNVFDSLLPDLFNERGAVAPLYFLLYRKDRLRCSLGLKRARTEAGTTSRRMLV